MSPTGTMHHVAIHARPREMWVELGPFLWVVRPDDRVRSRVWRRHWGPTPGAALPAAPWSPVWGPARTAVRAWRPTRLRPVTRSVTMGAGGAMAMTVFDVAAL